MFIFKKKHNPSSNLLSLASRGIWIVLTVSVILVGSALFFFSKTHLFKEEYLIHKSESLVRDILLKGGTGEVVVGGAGFNPFLLKVTLYDIKIKSPSFFLTLPQTDLKISLARMLAQKPFVVLKIKSPDITIVSSEIFPDFHDTNTAADRHPPSARKTQPLLGPIGVLAVEDGSLAYSKSDLKRVVILGKIFSDIHINKDNDIKGIIRASGGIKNEDTRLVWRFHNNGKTDDSISSDVFIKNLNISQLGDLPSFLDSPRFDVKIKMRYFISDKNLDISDVKIYNTSSYGFKFSANGSYDDSSGVGLLDGKWEHPSGIFKEGKVTFLWHKKDTGLVNLRIYTDETPSENSGIEKPHLDIGLCADFKAVPKGVAFKVFTTTGRISGITIENSPYSVENGSLKFESVFYETGASSASFNFLCDVFAKNKTLSVKHSASIIADFFSPYGGLNGKNSTTDIKFRFNSHRSEKEIKGKIHILNDSGTISGEISNHSPVPVPSSGESAGKIVFSGHINQPDNISSEVNFNINGFDISPVVDFITNYAHPVSGKIYCKKATLKSDEKYKIHFTAPGLMVKNFSLTQDEKTGISLTADTIEALWGKDGFVKVLNFRTSDDELKGNAEFYSTGRKKIELYARNAQIGLPLTLLFAQKKEEGGLESLSGVLNGKMLIEVSPSSVVSAGPKSPLISKGESDIKISSFAVNNNYIGDIAINAKFYPPLGEDSLVDFFCDRIVIRNLDHRGGTLSGGFSIVRGKIKGLFGFTHYNILPSNKEGVVLDGKITLNGKFKGLDDFDIKVISSPGFRIEKPIEYEDELSFMLISKDNLIKLFSFKFGEFISSGDDGIKIITRTDESLKKDLKYLSGKILLRNFPLKHIKYSDEKQVSAFLDGKESYISNMEIILGGRLDKPLIEGKIESILAIKISDNENYNLLLSSVSLSGQQFKYGSQLTGKFRYEPAEKIINFSDVRLALTESFSQGKDTRSYVMGGGYFSNKDGLKFSGRLWLNSISELGRLLNVSGLEDYKSGPVKADFKIFKKPDTSPITIEGEIESSDIRRASEPTLIERIKMKARYSDKTLEISDGLFRSESVEFKILEGSYLDFKTKTFNSRFLVGRLKAGFLSAIGKISVLGKYDVPVRNKNQEVLSGVVELEDFWVGARKFSREKILLSARENEISLKSPPDKNYQFNASYISNLSIDEAKVKNIIPQNLVFSTDSRIITNVKLNYADNLSTSDGSGKTTIPKPQSGAMLDASLVVIGWRGDVATAPKTNVIKNDMILTVRSSRLPVQSVSQLMFEEMPFEFSGHADINLDLNMDGQEEGGLSGTALIDISNGSMARIAFDEMKASISLADGILVVPHAELLKLPDYRINASGRLALPGLKDSGKKSSGAAPVMAKNDFIITITDGRLSMFENFDFVKKAEGLWSARVEIKGTREDPRITGFVKVENGMAELKMYLAKIQNLNMLATFKDNVIKLEELSGRSGSGRFLLSGAARLENFALTDMDFSFKNTTSEGIDLFVPELPIPTQFSKETGTKFISAYSYGKPKFELSLKGDPRSQMTLAGWVRLDNTYFSYPPPPQSVGAEDPLKDVLSKLNLSLALSAGENTWYENELASVNIAGGITLKGNYYAPYVSGSVESKRGYISYLGTDFKIQNARLDVSGEEAYLEGTATKEITSTRKGGYDTVQLIIDRALIGRIQPRFVSSDDPTLPSEKVVARVLGVNVENSSPEERDLVLRQGLIRLLDSSLTTPFAKTLLRKSGLVDMMKVSYAQPSSAQYDTTPVGGTAVSPTEGNVTRQSAGSALPDLLRGTKYTFEKYLTDQMLLGYSVTLDEYLNKLDLKHEIEVAYRWKGNVFLRGIYELDSKTLIRPPERRITVEQQWRFGWPKKETK